MDWLLTLTASLFVETNKQTIIHKHNTPRQTVLTLKNIAEN